MGNIILYDGYGIRYSPKKRVSRRLGGRAYDVHFKARPPIRIPVASVSMSETISSPPRGCRPRDAGDIFERSGGAGTTGIDSSEELGPRLGVDVGWPEWMLLGL